jgi:hypothetical protein
MKTPLSFGDDFFQSTKFFSIQFPFPLNHWFSDTIGKFSNVFFYRISGLTIARQEPLQAFDRFHKPRSVYQHKNVDNVKISLASKASCQVGRRVGRRLKFIADRAKKSEPAFTGFNDNIEFVSYYRVNWNRVSNFEKFSSGKTLCHGSPRFSYKFINRWALPMSSALISPSHP